MIVAAVIAVAAVVGAWLAVVRIDRARREAVAQAAAGEIRLRSYLDSAPDTLVVADADGVIVYVNEQVTALLGYDVDELLGECVDILVPTRARARHLELRTAYTSHAGRGPMGSLDLVARHRDGHEVPVEISLGPIETPEGTATLASLRDATAKRAADRALRDAEERFRHLSEHDPLTGLLNRRRFENELEAHLALCRRRRPAGALLSIDLDHFKDVNDAHGHHHGDRLLVAVAKAMRARLRVTDLLARQGGDEFLVLLRTGGEEAGDGAANGLCEAVRAAASAMGELGERVTASVGIVVFDQLPREDLTVQNAMIRADVALYAAKAAGRDGISVSR